MTYKLQWLKERIEKLKKEIEQDMYVGAAWGYASLELTDLEESYLEEWARASREEIRDP